MKPQLRILAIDERDPIRLPMNPSEPDTVESELPPPPPTEEEEEPCIFRVHEGLRHGNEKAYTPMLVSIGPYHHGRRKLLPMEKHKERYLKKLLQRNNKSEEDYLDSMRVLEERARKCYANPVDHLNNKKFVKMLLHDACFVTEFLHSMEKFPTMHDNSLATQERYVGDDPIVKVKWMRIQICSDLMRLENQLPFFVLSEFYGMSHGRTQIPTLQQLVMKPIVYMLPSDKKIFEDHFKNRQFSESKHFLDVVHNVCRPLPTINAGQHKHSIDADADQHSIDVDQHNHSTGSDKETCLEMPRVIELDEAGVTFEEKVECKEVSMFDIDFENGHFKIPKLTVDDWTETFFRNIIAYEQHSSDDEPKYFTHYTYFMDLLINSEEDVSQLRCHKIIDNMLGDDKEVAVMINNLNNGTIIARSEFHYSQLCSKVNAYYEKEWNRAVAVLKRDYFKNIWVTVATVAAAFLLFLSIAQTVMALITLLSSSQNSVSTLMSLA